MYEEAPPLPNKLGLVKLLDNFGNCLKEDYYKLCLINDYNENKIKVRNSYFNTELGLNIYSNENKPNIVGKRKKNIEVRDLTEEYNKMKEEEKNNEKNENEKKEIQNKEP